MVQNDVLIIGPSGLFPAAELTCQGVALIRPDGHIGFRSPSANAGALVALDRHLSSYLTPAPTVGPVK